MRATPLLLLFFVVCPGLARAEEPPASLDLEALAYDAEGMHLLRSSIFYNPRTPEGARRYHREIPSHHAARLFGLWWWESYKAADEASFRQRLARRQPALEALARTHETLIVHIAYMPDWLSRRQDGEPGPDLYKARNLVGPADPEAWARALRLLVDVLRPLDVDVCYEFWNEPDIQYWKGTYEEFFSLYALTARTLRAAHPEARIGGPAANGWRGRLARREEGDPLVLELLRYAHQHDLPLDFVSWHWFDVRTGQIALAADAIRTEARRLGLDPPDLLITEWNLPQWIRTRRYQPALMGEALLAMRAAGIHAQCMAALEDFHAGEEGKAYGLLEHGGAPRPAWAMHAALDALVRDAEGIAVVREEAVLPEMGTRVLLVARKRGPEGEGRTYEVLTWRCGVDARTAEGVRALRAAGYPEDALPFLPPDELRATFESDTPPRRPQHAEALAAARRRYQAEEEVVDVVRLAFPRPARRIQVERLEAEFVPVQAFEGASLIEVPTRPYEVLRIRIEP